ESTHYWWLLAQDAYFREFAADPRRDLSRLPPATLQRIAAQQPGPGYAPFYLYSKATATECGFFRYPASFRELATYSTKPQHHALRLAARHELEAQYQGPELWARVISQVAETLKREAQQKGRP
ncbi:MAG TPA: hypothetical protein VL359_09845, partial [bacterium]|nr:hypothetical protein [bacterium]